MNTYSIERLHRYALDCVPCINRKGYCSHCGARLEDGAHKCPSCGRTLERMAYGRSVRGYFAIQTTDGKGHRVEQYYQAKLTFAVRRAASIEFVMFVFAVTEDEKGRLSCIGRRAGQSIYGCIDYFSSNNTFVRRSLQSRQIDLISTCGIDRHCTSPSAWDAHRRRFGLVRYAFFMKHPHMETLMKMEHPLCHMVYGRQDLWRIDTYWAQIKIANRHHYMPEDWRMWFDTLDMLGDLGKDTHSPKWICPDDIEEMHNWATARKEAIREMETRERERRVAIEDAKARKSYAKRMRRWIGVAFDAKGLHAHVLRDVEEFIAEADAMHHCVFSNGYWKKDDCVILSVTDDEGNRLATIEYRPSDNRIMQCYAKFNRTPERKAEIEKFVLSHIKAA